ncbi:MAG: hypothetical protein JSW25_08520 [Thermoplasmata archaeon]|nr:MAG: hypothetical protein JSW25_08520 [Thermoplasmata archaeon]
MSAEEGKRTQDTLTWRRMVWPYVLTTYEDGRKEVEVRDAICPRCRARASYKQVGEKVLLSCHRCNISENYHPYGSYDELKEAVRQRILESLD